MLRTRLCRTLGIAHPVFSAGVGAAAGGERGAPVPNGGGFGLLGTGSLPSKFVREQIRRVRELSDRPFGINLVLPLLRRGTIEACLEEKVPVLVLFWGDVKTIVADARREGTKLFVQVVSPDEAMQAVQAGADGVIAQGFEAG